MAKKIIMPKQGLQMTEGIITKWLCKEGQVIEEGAPLFEMETDKLTITIDASVGGTLLKILHGEGDAVPVTEAIAIVGDPGEQVAVLVGERPPAPPTKLFATPRARMRAEETRVPLDAVAGSGPDGLVIECDVLASPLARKEAALAGAALERIAGSGARGKVMARDVRALETASAAETRIPLKGMRRVIAQRMCESLHELAQANHRMEVDMTQAADAREQLKQLGVKVSYNDVVIRCVARALKAHPMMNASMTESEIILKHDIHVGMAVATDGGLLVPVIRHADKLTLAEIAGRAQALGKSTKEGTLTPDELTGGTFTVTNLGMFGVDSFTAIINRPEAGILAVGQVKKKAVVMPDDQIAVRPMMELSLTYDHRIVDGAPAAKFLGEIKRLLEHPALLL